MKIGDFLEVGQFIHWAGESSSVLRRFFWDCFGVIIEKTPKKVTIATFDLTRKTGYFEKKHLIIQDPDIKKINTDDDFEDHGIIEPALVSEVNAYFDRMRFDLEESIKKLDQIKTDFVDKYANQNR